MGESFDLYSKENMEEVKKSMPSFSKFIRGIAESLIGGALIVGGVMTGFTPLGGGLIIAGTGFAGKGVNDMVAGVSGIDPIKIITTGGQQTDKEKPKGLLDLGLK